MNDQRICEIVVKIMRRPFPIPTKNVGVDKETFATTGSQSTHRWVSSLPQRCADG